MKAYKVSVNGEVYEVGASCRLIALSKALKEHAKDYNPRDMVGMDYCYKIFIERLK